MSLSFRKLFLLALSLAVLAGCKKDNSSPAPGRFGNGVFIAEEGTFTRNTGTLSYLDRSSSKYFSDVFAKQNGGQSLGDVVESSTTYNGKIYIVVNNSGKVEVADADSLRSLGTISSTSLPVTIPYQFVGINPQKGYIVQYDDPNYRGGPGAVAVVNLSTLQVTKKIPVIVGAKSLVVVGNTAYVAGNSFGRSNQISLVNTQTDTETGRITTGTGPNGLVVDANGKVWVSTNDQTSKIGTLLRINPSNNQVEQTFTLPAPPSLLTIDGGGTNLYYVSGANLVRFPISGSVPQNLYVHANIYGMGVDPKDGLVYLAITPNFTTAGRVLRYDVSKGAARDSFQVGVTPASFNFSR